MKKCPKGHENPDNANYCRVCKYEFHPVNIGNNEMLQKEIAKLKDEIGILMEERHKLEYERGKIKHENDKTKYENDKIKYENDNLKHVLDKERDTNEFYRHKIMELEHELHRVKIGGSIPTSKSAAKTKYTPDLFPAINLIPRSMFKPQFHLIWMAILLIFIAGLFLVSREYYYTIEREVGEISAVVMGPSIMLVGILIALRWLLRIFRCVQFKFSVDFIESKPMAGVPGKLHRIAKMGKLGLFDGNKKKIRILCSYDKVERFDNGHLLVEAGGKVGIYSLTRKRMIIPVKYNSISPFKNYIAVATWDRGVDHYDIKGNLKI